MLLAFTLCGHC